VSRADQLAQRHTDAAIEVVREVMTDPFAENRDRLAAAKLMLERGHGTSGPAVIQLPMDRRAAAMIAAMSDDELMAIVRAAPLPRLRNDAIDADFEVVSRRDPLLE
jgi:hypothetical protein